MPIENRNLEPDTKLISTYKKETFHALVVAGAEGKVLYQLSPYDGQEFKSPSSAGTAITGKACNGWAFWSLETDIGPSEPEEPDGSEGQGEDPSGEDTQQAPQTAQFRRVPNQKGVGEGEVRLYCDACQKSFTAPAGQQPENCPEGHGRDAGQPEAPED